MTTSPILKKPKGHHAHTDWYAATQPDAKQTVVQCALTRFYQNQTTADLDRNTPLEQ